MAEPPSAYRPGDVEPRWQAAWAAAGCHAARGEGGDPYYVLEMWPYPSGDLHMGHVRNYTLGDVLARFARQQGRDVLHPMGWDALGLPAENQAILEKVAPQVRTPENIARMRRQLEALGMSYDWSREIATYRPSYYRWNQWFFLRFFARGWVERRENAVNWCPACQTILANEQVEEDGSCWRGHAGVTTRRVAEWAFRTTAFAEDLLAGLDDLEAWPERITGQQRHWLGRSEGTRVRFATGGDGPAAPPIEIFTTRVDTLFGCTFLVVAPDHPAARALAGPREAEAIAALVAAGGGPQGRGREPERVGVPLGATARHPISGAEVPIWVGNYVVSDYGTGAVMGVPGHDSRDQAFARRYGLPVRAVVVPADGSPPPADAPFLADGVLVDSGPFSGLTSAAGRAAIAEALAAAGRGHAHVAWRLRDWGFSRQRYWGTPIPIVYCDSCGTVPLPESALPVVLPDFAEVDLDGKGGAPLAKLEAFVATRCPACGGSARRETDTMDTFVDSAWYFARFTSPAAQTAPFDPAAAARWLPVDVYVGGPEHAVMHLLYFRFWTRAMQALGLVDIAEPARRLLTQGMVQAPSYRCPKDGYLSPREARGQAPTSAGPPLCPRCHGPLEVAVEKMSKSKKNGIDPTEIVATYGADCARLFCLFAAPPEKDLEWSEEGIEGLSRFLARTWRLVEGTCARAAGDDGPMDRAAWSLAQEALRRVTVELSGRHHFNTAIAALMELGNSLSRLGLAQAESGQVGRAAAQRCLRLFAQMLAPFAPHLAEQMWHDLGGEGLCALAPWPALDAAALSRDLSRLAVQVAGRRRGEVEVPTDLEEAEVVARAAALPAVARHLAGRDIARTVVVPGRLVNFVLR